MNKPLQYFKFLISVHLAGLSFLTMFRVILLLQQFALTAGLPDKATLLSKALLIGVQFDNVIACYIMLLPLVVLNAAAVFKLYSKYLNRALVIYFSVFYAFVFAISAADIPYFDQFFKRLNVSVMNWAGEPAFVIDMIMQEPRYLIYIFLFLALVAVFIYVLNRLAGKFLAPLVNSTIFEKKRRHYLTTISASLVLLLLCIVGARGRLAEKSPIRVGTAYFSNYVFPNQLGLNPAFTLLQSAIEAGKPQNQSLRLMPNQQAIRNVRQFFGIPDTVSFNSPIARQVIPHKPVRKANVIVVMMESMSAGFMARNGNKHNLTPFLDSLSQQAYYFPNFYSSGIHTMNGIYSTLFAFPTLLEQHPLKPVEILEYTGFSHTLKENGYQTVYFTTHDDQFDNVGGFLKANAFEEVIAQKDYPADKVLSTLGVADDYMFDFSMPVLQEMNTKKKPFFAAFMTASNHGPIIIPEYFKPKSTDIKERAVQYSDWALRKFLQTAKKQPWFSNTIFVFLADHGNITGEQVYDMPLSYNHSPFIIYSPQLTKPAVFETMGTQVDAFPTVMGLLNIAYVNNTLGIDLLNEKRPYSYFSADDKIGCIDSSYFLIHRVNGNRSLHHYRVKATENLAEKNAAKAAEMQDYAFSMLQTAQYLIFTGKTGKQVPRRKK